MQDQLAEVEESKSADILALKDGVNFEKTEREAVSEELRATKIQLEDTKQKGETEVEALKAALETKCQEIDTLQKVMSDKETGSSCPAERDEVNVEQLRMALSEESAEKVKLSLMLEALDAKVAALEAEVVKKDDQILSLSSKLDEHAVAEQNEKHGVEASIQVS